MLTRRDVLRLAPAPFLARVARAAGGEDFERIDSHIHIHREAPAVFSSFKDSKWSGLDLVVCPTEGDEPYDLESRLESTRKAARSSGGRLAWASTFDARGFESPDFPARTIERLRRTFDDGAIGVKVWKNIGMAIRGEVRRLPAARRPRPAADLRGDRQGGQDPRRPPRRARRRVAAARRPQPRAAVLLEEPAVAHARARAPRPRRRSWRPATACSPASPTCGSSAATSAATRTTWAAWPGGSTPSPTSPSTPRPAPATSPAATATGPASS